jgi:hypothetical protein
MSPDKAVIEQAMNGTIGNDRDWCRHFDEATSRSIKKMAKRSGGHERVSRDNRLIFYAAAWGTDSPMSEQIAREGAEFGGKVGSYPNLQEKLFQLYDRSLRCRASERCFQARQPTALTDTSSPVCMFSHAPSARWQGKGST